MERFKNIIIGGGLTGLSTAFHLKDKYILFEMEKMVGGLVRTFEKNGFSFDMTGHWLHLRNTEIRAEVMNLFSDGIAEITRESKIFSHSITTEYPFQRNLYGLPLNIVSECLIGAIEAHCEKIKNPFEPDNFNDFVLYHFGKGISEHFMIPYNTKLWGVKPQKITKDWCDRFVPKPDIKEIIEGAIGLNRGEMGYNVKFLYPVKNGIFALSQAYADKLKNIMTSYEVTKVSLKEKWVEANGKRFKFENLISTIPLPEFLRIIVDVPEFVRKAGEGLKCVSLKYMNISLKTAKPIFGCHWLYLPENKWYFYRIGCYSNAVPYMAPMGMSSLYAEIRNDVEVSEEMAKRNLRELLFETSSIVSENDIFFEEFRTIPYAYVIYDQTRSRRLKTIFDYFKDKRVISTGRYGKWVYSAMEDAIIDGIDTVKKLVKV